MRRLGGEPRRLPQGVPVEDEPICGACDKGGRPQWRGHRCVEAAIVMVVAMVVTIG